MLYALRHDDSEVSGTCDFFTRITDIFTRQLSVAAGYKRPYYI